jgi:hypothetical protein
MINRVLILCGCALISSCASLYTPIQEPVDFLDHIDGTAISGGIVSNNAITSIQAGATKTNKKDISFNGSASLGVFGTSFVPNNPYNNSKSQSNIAVNLGWNTRRYTHYPIQLWAGLQVGRSSDAFHLAFFESPYGSDTLWQVYDDNDPLTYDSVKFERLRGGYFSQRLGASIVYLSNYENDSSIKRSKKNSFDIIGHHSLIPIRYNYTLQNPDIPNSYNTFLGWNAHLRYANKRRMWSFHTNTLINGKNLIDGLSKKNSTNPKPEFKHYVMINPSIGFTLFLK